MPPRDRVDRETRDRIVRWIKFKMRELRIETQREFAKRIKVHESTVSRALRNGPIGLDLVIGLHRELDESANRILDADPD